ncbi:MAG: PH domain-containing protein [Limnoraphis sp.]
MVRNLNLNNCSIMQEDNNMGLIGGLLGNASELKADGAKLDKLFSEVLVEGETIEKAYQLIRDLFVFTSKRLILVDKQGVTGKKIEFLSIPYSKITKFSKESAGHFDLDAELKIWVGSESTPIAKEFNRSVNINEVYAVLSKYVLN